MNGRRFNLFREWMRRRAIARAIEHWQYRRHNELIIGAQVTPISPALKEALRALCHNATKASGE